ncbi:hypothetical protein [Leptolyngbya sp. ST-U4]|uniref:hypothetical protein n=1 Tax=Leptolyngbya sp. ST-U4 TaxID=2933912 RepID=UPI003298298E
MNLGNSKQENWWSRLPFVDKVKGWNWTTIIPITLASIAIFFVLLTTWNSRYDAGYKAGAGEGAAYKPLYEQFQVENQKLLKQHDQDRSEITLLQKRVGQLEGKLGLFGRNATQAEAEETLNQAKQIQTETEQMRVQTFEQSAEIGRTSGRLEELEKRNQELADEIKGARAGVRVREVIIVALLAFGFLFERFFPRRNASTQMYPSYSNPNTVLTSAAVLETSDTTFLQDGYSNQQALPSKEQDNNTDTVNAAH